MNKSERLMNERIMFVTRRGQSAEIQRKNWLRRLRTKRSADPEGWVTAKFVGQMGFTNFNFCAHSWRAIKMEAKIIASFQQEPIEVLDANTLIPLFICLPCFDSCEDIISYTERAYQN